MKSHLLKKYSFAAFWALFLTMVSTSPSWAMGTQMDDVLESIVENTADLPGLITGFSYIMALLLGVTGIFKLKDHVDNPTQTPLRTPIIRFIIGGALLSLPAIYIAMETAINYGSDTDFDVDNSVLGFFLGLLGSVTASLTIIPNLNGILGTLMNSMADVPGFITALAYILGLVSGVSGLLKVKDHVENPDQTPMREGVIRFLVGGALFAIPTIYQAMYDAVNGGGLTALGAITSTIATASLFFSGYGLSANIDFSDLTNASMVSSGICDPTKTTLGASLCGVIWNAGAFPAFLNAVAYIFGLVLGLMGILKIRDHVLNPTQTAVWEGFSRLIAGGLFFALPIVVEIARASVAHIGLTAFTLTPNGLNSYNESNIDCGGGGITALISSLASNVSANVGGTDVDLGDAVDAADTKADLDELAGNTTPVASGLDGMLACMMRDMLGPVHVVLNLFTMTAGTIFLMIGINRLTKSAQEGARGPGGLGTIMTFITGGALIAYNELIRGMTTTLGMGMYGLAPISQNFATLTYTGGMSTPEIEAAHNVITAIIKVMIMIGLISFVRGIFIIRGVAEGNQGNSMMAGMTHIIAGALAVNIGPLMKAIQATLNITTYGIQFS